MKNQFYYESIPYEIFVRRAFREPDLTAVGMNHTFFQNLMLKEENAEIVRHLDTYEDQLKRVKKILLQAFKKFSKQKIDSTEKEILDSLKEKVKVAETSEQLLKIIEIAIQTTDRYKFF
jgi:uncharacterized membrane protein YgaE (UPF0421/DUF939 family)